MTEPEKNSALPLDAERGRELSHKRKVRIALIVMSLLLLGACLIRIGCALRRAIEVPDIEVWLSEPVERLRGRKWLVFDDGTLSELSGTAENTRVTVHLPDGRSITTISTTLYMEQENGQVIEVSLTPEPQLKKPRQPKLVGFGEAINEVERLIAQLDAPDVSRARERIARWKLVNPESGPFAPDFMAEISLVDTTIEFQIESDPEGDGWFVVMTFYDETHNRSKQTK